MASYGYLQTCGASHGSSLSGSYIVCFHQQERKDVILCLLNKWIKLSIDYIIHFHRKSGKTWLIPLESDTCEQLLGNKPELLDNAEHISDNCESLLVTKNGQINVFNEHKEKVGNIVYRIIESRFSRLINIEDIDSEISESCESTEAVPAKSRKVEHTDNDSCSEEMKVKKFICNSTTLLYSFLQRKYGKSIECRPPAEEVFSVARKNDNVRLPKKGEKRNNNNSKRKWWYVFKDASTVTWNVSRNTADDNDSRENYFDEINAVSVSPTKIGEKGKYNPAIVKHLREITNLPLDERPRRLTVLAYPSRKGKLNKSANSRRGRTHNSQASEGIADQYPTQVSDAVNENPDLPPSELVQTSSRSIFQTFTNNTPTPTTSLVPNVDSERALMLRIRGQLPVSRLSQTQQPPRHPQYTDQPSRQRSFANWPSNTGQDSTRMAIYGFFYTGMILSYTRVPFYN